MFIDVIKTKTHSILSEAYDPKVSLYVFCCTEFFVAYKSRTIIHARNFCTYLHCLNCLCSEHLTLTMPGPWCQTRH